MTLWTRCLTGLSIGLATTALFAGNGCSKDAPAPVTETVDVTPAPQASPPGEALPSKPEMGRPRQGLEPSRPVETTPAEAQELKGALASPTLAHLPALAEAAAVIDVAALLAAPDLDVLRGLLKEDSGLDAELLALGQSVLQASGWTALGLDPDGAVALATAYGDASFRMASLPVKDRELLVTQLKALADKLGLEVETAERDDALILTARGVPGALIVTEAVATWADTVGSGDAGGNRAAALALETVPSSRLRSSRSFATALQHLGDAAAIGWIGPRMLGAVARDSAVLGALLLRERVGAADGIGFGLSVEGATVAVQAFLPLEQGSHLRDVLRPGGPLAAGRLVSDDTLFAYAGRVDPKRYLALLLGASGDPDGEALDELVELLRGAGGIDLEADVFGQLTGEFGLVLERTPGVSPEVSFLQAFRGAFLLGVKDAARALKTLEAAASAGGGTMTRWEPERGALVLSAPAGAVDVTVSGAYLIATNHEPWREAIAGEGASGLSALIGSERMRAALGSERVAGAAAVGLSILEHLLLSGSEVDGLLWPPPPLHVEDDPELERAVEALETAYEAARAEQRAAQEAAAAAGRRMLERLGRLSHITEVVDDGLLLHFSLTPEAGTTLLGWLRDYFTFEQAPPMGEATRRYRAMRKELIERAGAGTAGGE